jgi:hypothetical protein
MRGVVVATVLSWGGDGCDRSELGVMEATATNLRWR